MRIQPLPRAHTHGWTVRRTSDGHVFIGGWPCAQRARCSYQTPHQHFGEIEDTAFLKLVLPVDIPLAGGVELSGAL